MARVYTSDKSFSNGISRNKRSANLHSDPAGCAWESHENIHGNLIVKHEGLNVARSCLQ